MDLVSEPQQSASSTSPEARSTGMTMDTSACPASGQCPPPAGAGRLFQVADELGHQDGQQVADHLGQHDGPDRLPVAQANGVGGLGLSAVRIDDAGREDFCGDGSAAQGVQPKVSCSRRRRGWSWPGVCRSSRGHLLPGSAGMVPIKPRQAISADAAPRADLWHLQSSPRQAATK